MNVFTYNDNYDIEVDPVDVFRFNRWTAEGMSPIRE